MNIFTYYPTWVCVQVIMCMGGWQSLLYCSENLVSYVDAWALYIGRLVEKASAAAVAGKSLQYIAISPQNA